MACYLNGTCCDGNQTGKEELTGFTHRAGGQNNRPPFLSICTLKVGIIPQIYQGGVWINMSLVYANIGTSPASASPYSSYPCSKNTTFTLTPRVGSGGATLAVVIEFLTRPMFIIATSQYR